MFPPAANAIVLSLNSTPDYLIGGFVYCHGPLSDLRLRDRGEKECSRWDPKLDVATRVKPVKMDGYPSHGLPKWSTGYRPLIMMTCKLLPHLPWLDRGD